VTKALKKSLKKEPLPFAISTAYFPLLKWHDYKFSGPFMTFRTQPY